MRQATLEDAEDLRLEKLMSVKFSGVTQNLGEIFRHFDMQAKERSSSS